MKSYSVSHVADHVLLHELATFNMQDRASTVGLLVRLAEVEARKLYLPAAHPSMYSYCIGEMRMSEDIALKRLRAARAARRFPAIYAALADGRLHLSGVALLARYLKKDNAAELLAAAVHKTKAEIERLIAQHFPQPDVPTVVRALVPAAVAAAPILPELRPVAELAEVLPAPGPVNTFALQQAPVPVHESPAPDPMQTVPTYNRVAPLAPGKFALQGTMCQAMHDQLIYAKSLLGHAVASGDEMAVLHRALNEMVERLERRKFAKCVRSRPRRGAPKGRYVPAEVRRMVWQRDQGQCTFASNNGKRCEATSRLEFDHVEPVAKGGQSTASNLRLRCRAHNQYAADCAFGTGFMHTKREEARRRSAEAKAQAEIAAEARARERAEAAAKAARQEEIVPWLRQLGYSVLDARRGAALAADLADAPLEQRVRVALEGLAPRWARPTAPVVSCRA